MMDIELRPKFILIQITNRLFLRESQQDALTNLFRFYSDAPIPYDIDSQCSRIGIGHRIIIIVCITNRLN